MMQENRLKRWLKCNQWNILENHLAICIKTLCKIRTFCLNKKITYRMAKSVSSKLCD